MLKYIVFLTLHNIANWVKTSIICSIKYPEFKNLVNHNIILIKYKEYNRQLPPNMCGYEWRINTNDTKCHCVFVTGVWNYFPDKIEMCSTLKLFKNVLEITITQYFDRCLVFICSWIWHKWTIISFCFHSLNILCLSIWLCECSLYLEWCQGQELCKLQASAYTLFHDSYQENIWI